MECTMREQVYGTGLSGSCSGVLGWGRAPALAGGRPPRFKQKGSCGDQAHTQPWVATVCRLRNRKRTGQHQYTIRSYLGVGLGFWCATRSSQNSFIPSILDLANASIQQSWAREANHKYQPLFKALTHKPPLILFWYMPLPIWGLKFPLGLHLSTPFSFLPTPSELA